MAKYTTARLLTQVMKIIGTVYPPNLAFSDPIKYGPTTPVNADASALVIFPYYKELASITKASSLCLQGVAMHTHEE